MQSKDGKIIGRKQNRVCRSSTERNNKSLLGASSLKMGVTDQKMIDEAQTFADKWLPSECCVMDIALVNGELKVIEFNAINSSGMYDSDVVAIFKALWEYHQTKELQK